MDDDFKYLSLDPKKINETITKLSIRIDERFPGSGLYLVSRKLLSVGERAEDQVKWFAKPIIGLRVAIAVLILLMLTAIVVTITQLSTPSLNIGVIEFIQVLESGINDLVLIAIAIFFLVSIEKRLKRHRALKAIHELRAIAHIIDMHQLTKDPDRLLWESKGLVAPKGNMSAFLLTRYLDYCSELLSLVGKVSVVYVQDLDDPVALSAVNEIENLTTGLSRKIWQKLITLHRGADF